MSGTEEDPDTPKTSEIHSRRPQIYRKFTPAEIKEIEEETAQFEWACSQ
jgi:hypothetical protein